MRSQISTTILLLSTGALSWPVPSQEILDLAYNPNYLLMGLTSNLGPEAMKSLEDFQDEFDINLADAFMPEPFEDNLIIAAKNPQYLEELSSYSDDEDYVLDYLPPLYDDDTIDNVPYLSEDESPLNDDDEVFPQFEYPYDDGNSSSDVELDDLELDYPTLIEIQDQLLSISDEISDLLGSGDDDYPSVFELEGY